MNVVHRRGERPIGTWLLSGFYVVIVSSTPVLFLVGVLGGVPEPTPVESIVYPMGLVLAFYAAYHLFGMTARAPAACTAVAAYLLLVDMYKWLAFGYPGVFSTLIGLWGAVYAWRLRECGLLASNGSAS